MTKLKILVSAYACEPGLGSEIGVGWHWVLEMSHYFELWVVTRESNRHTIEPWIARHPEYQPIRFLYYDLPRWARFWKKGLRGVRIYYNMWQRGCDKIVKRTMQENGIGIFHHLTYGNFLWPVSRYGQKQFFVWGPGSAGNVVPKEFSREYSFKGQIKEGLQRWIRSTLKYNRGFQKRCESSWLIVCKTTDTYACIPESERHKAILMTDVAVEKFDIPPSEKPPESTVKYLAVGTLDGWRGFDLLIEAFSKALKSNPNLMLEIAGMGNEHPKLQALIRKMGASSHIRLLGKITAEAYVEKMREADVVVNPCLREGAVTVAFDSMSFGKPLLCIETGGYTRYFNNDCAVIIPLGTRPQTIEHMAAAILELSDAPTRLDKSRKAQEAGELYTWEHKGRQIYQAIHTAYLAWINSKKI